MNTVIDSTPADADVPKREAAVQSYAIIDTPPEAQFDEFAELAASVTSSPIAFISFVDGVRVWSKAAVGIECSALEQDPSFCLRTLESAEFLIVSDALNDPRFAGSSWVSGPSQIRFFAGAPLIDRDGHAVGTLAVMDVVPRKFTFEQTDALRTLSRHVMAQLELRRRVMIFKNDDKERQVMLAALKNAVRGGEFVVHYQPKIRLHDGAPVGLEALIRWDRPGHGLVSPHSFIPLLEESGLIREVGAWVLGQSADHFRDWSDKPFKAPRIAVNVSPAQFHDPHFVDELKRATGGDASRAGVDLEIGEALLTGDADKVIEKLAAIRGLGISVSVDNFGTGPSSWRCLARLPIDVLKIDRSFVSSMTTSATGLLIVSSMISLAHGLDLKVVAEGVESEAQRELLLGLGCDEIQGYLISHPLTKREIEHFLMDDLRTRTDYRHWTSRSAAR